MSFEDEQRRLQQERQRQRDLEINKRASIQDEQQRLRSSQMGDATQGLFEPGGAYDSRLMELAKQNLAKKEAAEKLIPRAPIAGPAKDAAIMGAGQMYNNIRNRDALSEQEQFDLANSQQNSLDAQADARDKELEQQRFLKLQQQLNGG